MDAVMPFRREKLCSFMNRGHTKAAKFWDVGTGEHQNK